MLETNDHDIKTTLEQEYEAYGKLFEKHHNLVGKIADVYEVGYECHKLVTE